MINLAEFTAQLEEKLANMTEEDLEELFSTKEIDYNYCESCARNNLTTCGKCGCGKDGHVRSILFFTSAYCVECYEKSIKNAENRIDNS